MVTFLLLSLVQNIVKNWSIKMNVFDPNFESNTLSFFDSLLLIFWEGVSV
jgi:hypothetical protein